MTQERDATRIEVDADGYDQPGRLPLLVRVYIRQCLIGFVLAAVFVGLLLGFDVARLRSLIFATQGGWIALVLLVFFNGVVFAGVQFAITIMRMSDGGSGGGKPARLGWSLPRHLRRTAPVKVKAAGPQRPWSA
jgi:hypothetical protein